MNTAYERYEAKRIADERNSIDDIDSAAEIAGPDFSSYPQFSLISDFIDYMGSSYYVSSYYASCQEATRNRFIYELGDKKCEVCGEAALYIRLTIAVKDCTLASLWLHRTFCSEVCCAYFYTVKKLGGTP